MESLQYHRIKQMQQPNNNSASQEGESGSAPTQITFRVSRDTAWALVKIAAARQTTRQRLLAQVAEDLVREAGAAA